jgi:leucyl aminopeptidase
VFAIRLVSTSDPADTWVLPVGAAGRVAAGPLPAGARDSGLAEEAAEMCRVTADAARAGVVHPLPRPLRSPSRVLLAGTGTADEAGWRAAGAAVIRSAAPDEQLAVLLPAQTGPDAVRGLAEGLWLAGYRYRDAPGPARTAEVRLVVPEDTGRFDDSLTAARVTAAATWLARDLTNTPSSVKSPQWLADQIVEQAAGRPGLTVRVWTPDELAAEGFGGILAVGGGSASGPRFVELSWSPPDATRHVVLVGKGITFDTGGISIKPRDGMLLMRKDMAGAAAVLAATLGAAELGLPVRVTALAPLAENMVSGSAYRPGDVVRHYDGTTSETTNSDAEGRLVLADALAYATAVLRPDVVIDLATLTGANAVALGRRTAALYSHDDALAGALTAAADAAGERAWRMPLPDDYVDYLSSDIADRHSSPMRGAGSVTAALFLREFLGDRVDRWAHVDMSAPSWIDTAEAELAVGATGWGARTLLRYLSA